MGYRFIFGQDTITNDYIDHNSHFIDTTAKISKDFHLSAFILDYYPEDNEEASLRTLISRLVQAKLINYLAPFGPLTLRNKQMIGCANQDISRSYLSLEEALLLKNGLA